MILGISSYTYGWAVGVAGAVPASPMNEIDLINKAIGFQVSLLQIGDNLPVHTFSEDRLYNFRRCLQEKNITLELGAKELTTQNLEKYLTLARFFNVRLLRFVIDGAEYKPTLQEIVNIISEFIPQLEESNITLGIENHDRFEASALANMIEKCASKNVGICMDCVNSMGAGEGLKEVADTLAPYTVNLHIKDFQVQRLGHLMGFTVTGAVAGKGMTNLPDLINKLKPFGRCQTAVLEQWVTPEDTIEATIIKEHQWAEESMLYLTAISTFKKIKTLNNIL